MTNLDKFVKNGITYDAIHIGTFKALYALSGDNIPVGYEVARVYQRQTKYNPSGARTITCNSDFGKDGSKSFYTLERAKAYYDQLGPLKSQVS